jgi:hypothetical protein
MDKKCEAKFDGYRCQLPKNHSGSHANYGTKKLGPVFVRWSDEGVKAVEKEQRVSAGL